jgi:hypothetical protein
MELEGAEGLWRRQSWGDRIVERCKRWKENREGKKRAKEEAKREREEEYQLMLQYIRRQKK